jgi:putative nucleotidyltransferase with HDIG domain
MSSNKSSKPKFHQIISLVLAALTIIFLVFYGSLPVSYDYEVGSIAGQDIYATRSFADSYETERRAIIARDTVDDIFVRSDKQSEECIDRVEAFFDQASQIRKSSQTTDLQAPLSPSSSAYQLSQTIEKNMGKKIESESLTVFFEMSNATFTYIREKTTAIAELVMLSDVNDAVLPTKITEQINSFCDSNPSYSKFAESMDAVLVALLEPNTVYDQKATEDSANNAYNAVMNEPVMVEKGTKLVEAGDIIDEHAYSNLQALELIRDQSFDLVIFARVAIYVLVLSSILLMYLNIERKKLKVETPVFYLLIITFLVTIGTSVYLSSLSSLLCIVLFFAAVCATYLGTQNGIILAVLNLLYIWPMYGFDPELFFINLAGIILCSIFAGRTDKIINNAALIFFPTLGAIITSVAYNFLIGNNTRTAFLNSFIFTFVSAIASLVAAIGLSPIFELVCNVASPVKLISLSQPGQHLLKRLFLEASGTHQHSMMVANLADSAAEAIGADSLLCKVAAYYHDIGKLENPEYFTENQHGGVNPHDNLTVMESVAIITKHPEDGVKLAKKERLPNAIIKIIDEHHGTTYPSYFYKKAVEDAKARGLEPPDVANFRYRGHIPSSRESAIVMLADTCEAAVRSMKTSDVAGAEQLIRVLIKDKIDQDQLINSGLSFDDVEKIIIAFKQVYAGVFHERIKYPE